MVITTHTLHTTLYPKLKISRDFSNPLKKFLMKRVTLYYSVVVFSLIMMTASLATLFMCKSNEQLMFTTWSFIGWGALGSILLCTRK